MISNVCARSLVCALLLLAFVEPAQAGGLRGQVTCSLTGLPLAGVQVRIEQTDAFALTDAEGRYHFDGLRTGTRYDLELRPTTLVLGPERLRVVRQIASDTPRLEQVPMYTTEFLETHAPLDEPYGLPSQTSGRFDEPSIGPVDLEVFAREHAISGPLFQTMPTPLPATILVGRRFTGNCGDAPVSEIQEIPLEDYVKGVVYAEVGVFGAVEPRDVAAIESWKTFAIAARSYALYWYVRDPDASNNGYHLDDTACKQRYLDTRDDDVDAAVAQTAGLVFIKKGTTAEFDQFEYAASCGEHGSRPEYQTELVPDQVPGEACAGSWCGHNNCAAHEDNPAVPGADRCLVRGVCQWGSVERSKNGETMEQIVEHYQPNLEVRNFAQLDLQGFVREDDLFDGPGIEGVDVNLNGVSSTTTDGDGFYVFADVSGGAQTLTFTKTGYQDHVADIEIAGAGAWWYTIQLLAEGQVVEPGSDLSAGGQDTSSISLPDTASPGTDSGASGVQDIAVAGSDAGVFPALRASDGQNPGCGCTLMRGQGKGRPSSGLWWLSTLLAAGFLRRVRAE